MASGWIWTCFNSVQRRLNQTVALSVAYSECAQICATREEGLSQVNRTRYSFRYGARTRPCLIGREWFERMARSGDSNFRPSALRAEGQRRRAILPTLFSSMRWRNGRFLATNHVFQALSTRYEQQVGCPVCRREFRVRRRTYRLRPTSTHSHRTALRQIRPSRGLPDCK